MEGDLCPDNRQLWLNAISGGRSQSKNDGRGVGLFDHLVGPGEQRDWHGEAEPPGRFEVHHQLEIHLLPHRVSRSATELSGFTRKAIASALGTSSRSNSNRLATSTLPKAATPVTFAPAGNRILSSFALRTRRSDGFCLRQCPR